jgi:cellobiose phosphorylase
MYTLFLPHTGRGGLDVVYRICQLVLSAGLEYILGFKKIGEQLVLDPCIPQKWEKYSLKYKYLDTRYQIEVTKSQWSNRGVKRVILDGKKLEGNVVPLVNDGKEHKAEVRLGK